MAPVYDGLVPSEGLGGDCDDGLDGVGFAFLVIAENRGTMVSRRGASADQSGLVVPQGGCGGQSASSQAD